MKGWIVAILFLSLLFLLLPPLSQESPLTTTGYWQGEIQAEGSSKVLQFWLSQNETAVTGWAKLIEGYSFSIWLINTGTFDPEERALTVQATNPENPGEAYSFVGTVSPNSMSGEGTYTDGNREEHFTWSAQRGKSYANLSGAWKGEISKETLEAELQLDLAQSKDQLSGWISIKVGGAMVMLALSSGKVDQERKLVTIIAQGAPFLGKKEHYAFTGTLLLSEEGWVKMAGTCHFSSNGTEEDLTWSATKVSKGQEIE